MSVDPKIDGRLTEFVSKIQIELLAYYSERFSSIGAPSIEIMTGNKFYRIIYQSTGGCTLTRSVFCFVDKSNGDIYKAATWNARAKHVRGNIFDENYSWDKGVNIYGGTYLQ